jgi:hypothetical protein
MLDVSDNRLSGQLPDSYARLRFLSTLSLRGNALNATLPAAWAGGMPELLQLCVCLARVFFAPCSFCLVEACAHLQLLRRRRPSSGAAAAPRRQPLLLHTHNTHPPQPKTKHPQKITHTRSDASSNALSGQLPAAWGGGLPALRLLNLGSNALSGQLPPEWANMTSLQTL